MILNGLLWKQTEIILLFLILYPGTAFQTLVEYEGYSIFSKRFLPTVVDIMVIRINLAHCIPFLFSSFQFCSVAQSCLPLCNPMNRSMPGLPVHHQLPEFTQTHVHRVVMPSSHLILCCPLLLLPPIPPSIRVFSNESTLRMRWLKYWSFSFSISPSNEHPGLIFFRMDWLDLLAVQGTFQESSSTPQFKSISSSAFSLLYGPTLTSMHDYWKKHSFD